MEHLCPCEAMVGAGTAVGPEALLVRTSCSSMHPLEVSMTTAYVVAEDVQAPKVVLCLLDHVPAAQACSPRATRMWEVKQTL